MSQRHLASDILPAFGKSLSVQDWSQSPLCRVPLELVLNRINSGWGLEAALSTPVRAVKSSGKRSRYWGVSWAKHQRQWRAQIKVEGRKGVKLLGYFNSESDAARAYDRTAVALRGREAVVNFPGEWPGHSQAPVKEV